jgi:hypothetical protein
LGLEIWDVGYEIRDAGYGIWDAGNGGRKDKGIRNWRFDYILALEIPDFHLSLIIIGEKFIFFFVKVIKNTLKVLKINYL